jgi:hypothetical protein
VDYGVAAEAELRSLMYAGITPAAVKAHFDNTTGAPSACVGVDETLVGGGFSSAVARSNAVGTSLEYTSILQGKAMHERAV